MCFSVLVFLGRGRGGERTCFTSDESLRADDIPNAVAGEEDRGGELFLSVAGDIARYHG